MEEIHETINTVYTNLQSSGSYSSIKKLLTESKKINPDITEENVVSFLSKQPSYTLYKKLPRKFVRRKFMYPYSGHTFVADICYLTSFSKENGKFLLVMIDGFSRFMFAYPVKSLKSKDMLPTLQKAFDESLYPVQKLHTDEGIEFVNKQAKSLYKKLGIHHYFTFNRDIKASIAERAIQTLKKKITRFVEHTKNPVFIEHLDDIVYSYNISDHRGILNKKPIDLYLLRDWEEIKNISKNLYKHHVSKIKSVKHNYSIGNVVRIKAADKIFSKVTDQCNTKELFRIKEVLDTSPTTYKLSSLDNENDLILGSFYAQELVLAHDPKIYDIDVIKKRVRKGKVEYLVRYPDYPNYPLSWIKENQLSK